MQERIFFNCSTVANLYTAVVAPQNGTMSDVAMFADMYVTDDHGCLANVAVAADHGHSISVAIYGHLIVVPKNEVGWVKNGSPYVHACLQAVFIFLQYQFIADFTIAKSF